MRRYSRVASVFLLFVLVILPAAVYADCWNGMFPDSGRRFLTGEDLKYLEGEELWMARNEIFARHGYIFKTKMGKDFAASLCNYSPTESDVSKVQSRFNQFEAKNVTLIAKYEKALKSGSAVMAPASPPMESPYLYPDSDTRYLTINELNMLAGHPDGKDLAWQARNEIFARRGYIFKSDRGKALARGLGAMYRGDEPDAGKVMQRFNKFEKKNVEMLKKLEDRLK